MKKMSIVERLDLLLSLRTEDMDLEHDRKTWKNNDITFSFLIISTE